MHNLSTFSYFKTFLKQCPFVQKNAFFYCYLDHLHQELYRHNYIQLRSLMKSKGKSVPTTCLVPDTQSCGLLMRREYRERFPHRGLSIPTWITAREWRTFRDACRDRFPLKSVAGKTFPTFPAHVCATSNFTYLVRGRWLWNIFNNLHFIIW